MDSAEFTWWQGMNLIEPIGTAAEDERHGILCSLLANLKRDSRRRPKAYVPDDFIPWRRALVVSGDSTPAADGEMKAARLEDPVAHSNLIRQAVFGMSPRAKRKKK